MWKSRGGRRVLALSGNMGGLVLIKGRDGRLWSMRSMSTLKSHGRSPMSISPRASSLATTLGSNYDDMLSTGEGQQPPPTSLPWSRNYRLQNLLLIRIRPPACSLHTAAPIPSDRLITDYKSSITPSPSYLFDPLNVYARLGMPNPSCTFSGLHWAWPWIPDWLVITAVSMCRKGKDGVYPLNVSYCSRANQQLSSNL